MITLLTASSFPLQRQGLADLLVDAVHGGASLGFVEPFDHDQATAWWNTRLPAILDGSLAVWVAHASPGIVGTVSLALESKPNGRHRGEILKLVVHRDARGQGLGRSLLAVASAAAASAGRTLLLLDTETGSAAESLYDSAGWTRYGIVPGYAANPAGPLEDCTFFYKHLI